MKLMHVYRYGSSADDDSGKIIPIIRNGILQLLVILGVHGQSHYQCKTDISYLLSYLVFRNILMKAMVIRAGKKSSLEKALKGLLFEQTRLSRGQH